jgi:hypothetical protein
MYGIEFVVVCILGLGWFSLSCAFTQWLYGVFALVFLCAEEDGKDLLGEVVVRVVDACVRVDYVVINCRIV